MAEKALNDYHQHYLKEDIRQAKLGILLLALPLTLFAINDYAFFGLSETFYLLLELRLVFLAFTVLFAFYITRIKKYNQFIRSEFYWALSGVIITLIINYLRPPQTFLFHTITVIILVFVSWLVIPQTLRNKTVLTMTLSVGELLILSTLSLQLSVWFTLIFSLSITNIIGFSSAKWFEGYRKRNYQSHQQIAFSEQKYREFADALPEIAFEADENGKLIFFNKKSSEILGYTHQELMGSEIFNYLAPDDLQRGKENFELHLKMGRTSSNQYQLKKKDGTAIPVIVFSERTRSQTGKLIVRSVIVNITDLEESREKLRTLNEKLKVVGNLTRHDAANKLMGMKLNLYLLKKKLGDNPDALGYVEQIAAGVDSTQRIFELSRIYEQIGSEKLTAVDVYDSFQKAVNLTSNLTGITVINQTGGLTVTADSLLTQLFYNFIDNTLKYGMKVSEITVNFKDTQENILLTYKDNGVGIPVENKDKIFDEGFTTGKGSGHGLKLTKRMIEVYGWTIKEVGVPEEGAVFEITIPKKHTKTVTD
jgi:PAS domain S-box-containing protein